MEFLTHINRSPAHNSTYKKLAVRCFVSTFVVQQTFVLRMNICGKNRQLLVAANRYGQFAKKSLDLWKN